MYNAEHHQSKAEEFHAPLTIPVCHSLYNTQEHLIGLMDLCIYLYMYRGARGPLGHGVHWDTGHIWIIILLRIPI